MTSLTCISCKLIFSEPELHLEHYRSEWHCYNIKRRLAELEPVTKNEYEAKKISLQQIPVSKKVSARCDSCRKTFNTQNALVNHLKSKKHISSFEIIPEDDQVTIRCDLCNKSFSTQNSYNNHLQSKKHMEIESNPKAVGKKKWKPAKKQDFVKKLDDKNEMAVTVEDEDWTDDSDWESDDDEIEDGQERIVVDTNDCLFCDHSCNSTEENVQHMTTEHSFFIPDIEHLINLDGLIATLAGKIHAGRLCLWCDGKGRGFKSVKAVRGHMLDKGHCKMLYEGEAILDYADFYNYRAVDDSTDPTDVHAIEEWLGNTEYELVLPSGATIGHRSLSIYFKQNLKPVSSDNQTKVRKLVQQYKALGYTGTSGPAAKKIAKDISFVQRMKSRFELKIALKANRFQPHFRRQVAY